jgi:predicted metalloprotease with PDZ domain
MIRLIAPFAAVALLVAGCSSSVTSTRPSSLTPSVAYAVTIPSLDSESFHVEATLRGFADDTLLFDFPVWAPGAYDIVNFGRFVTKLEARDDGGRALAVLHPDTNTFAIVRSGAREIRLAYSVHDIEYLPNSAWFGLSDIERQWAFANGTALFGYPVGHKDIPFEVTYTPPPGWDVAVALDPVAGAVAHRYAARNYDELVDAPVEMGTFQRFDFTVGGVPHEITVIAPEKVPPEEGRQLIEKTQKIVTAMTGLFGDMPYKRYLFQHFLSDPREGGAHYGFGALEHANSSTYRMPYWGNEGLASGLQAVIAHEYWHLWSPKRIHVSQLGPFDYQHGPVTSSLWFAEGFTEHYARMMLARLGMSTPRGYLAEFQSDMTGLYQEPQDEPMTELSRRITSAPMNEMVDLYKRGPLLGFLLDAEIRWQTRNERTLDDAMRLFNEEFGKTGRTFEDDQIIPIIERATGAKLGDFYARYIAGRDTLPFDVEFSHTGLSYVVRDTMRPGLGVELRPVRGGALVAKVLAGGSADAMGLREGDVITRLEFGESHSFPVSSVPLQYVDRFFADSIESSTGDEVYSVRAISIMRGDSPITVPAVVKVSPAIIERLDIDPTASGLALTIRQSMLGF